MLGFGCRVRQAINITLDLHVGLRSTGRGSCRRMSASEIRHSVLLHEASWLGSGPAIFQLPSGWLRAETRDGVFASESETLVFGGAVYVVLQPESAASGSGRITHATASWLDSPNIV